MIVNCEECGTRYRLDETKIKGSSAKVRCKSCGHVMHVTKPEHESVASGLSGTGDFSTTDSTPSSGAEERESAPSGPEASTASSDTGGTTQGKASTTDESGSKRSRSKAGSTGRPKGLLGIRSKMFLLFVCLPVVLTIVAGYIYLQRVERIKNDFGEQINSVVTQMGESQVAAKTRATARELDLYLSSHPDLEAEDLNQDRAVRRMAVQKVGETGYTFLYQLPGEGNTWDVLVHPNPEMTGSDLAQRQGASGFTGIIKNTSGGKEANGFYTQPTQSGERVKRYLFCSPVGDTGYVVASSIELDSMIQPAHILNTQLDTTYVTMRNRTLLILGGLALLFLIIVTWYGHRLTKRIHTLTDVAERISVGELEAEVEIKGKDEISSLAEAISRMQESVRLSIERLRRRRT